MIGRALRCAVNLEMLPEVTLWVDCDVLTADGGTRTTAINGAAVAVYDALLWMEEQRKLREWPMRGLVSAISIGILNGEIIADLDYKEDSKVDLALNVICSSDNQLVEVQGAAETRPFSVEQLHEILTMAQANCTDICSLQKKALGI